MTKLLTVTVPDSQRKTTIRLNTDKKTVHVDGIPCCLTMQEFLLFVELAKAQGRMVTRDKLLATAWGFASPGKTRTVDVHVQRLRKKLGSFLIETVHGQGYRMCASVLATG